MDYLTIASPCEASLTEKRSEFIAQLFPVSNADDFTRILDEIRGKHHKARHNVWAYRLRSDGAQRYSDDGEPQGTGGIPVLNVLQRSFGFVIKCTISLSIIIKHFLSQYNECLSLFQNPIHRHHIQSLNRQ